MTRLLLLPFMPPVWLVVLVSSENVSIPITRPDCKESCGNSTSDVKIPFPFGIGPGCYHDPWYEIICGVSSSDHSPRAYLRKFGYEIVSIQSCLGSSDSCDVRDLTMQVLTPWEKNASFVDLGGSPFSFSVDGNTFVVRGCPGYATVMDRNGDAIAGCSPVCKAGDMKVQEMKWQSSLIEFNTGTSSRFVFYQVDLTSKTAANTSGMMVALMSKSWQEMEWVYYHNPDQIPTVLYWSLPSLPQEIGNHQNSRGVTCAAEICTCSYNYRGNPYLPYGCQVIDPCTEGAQHSLHCLKKTSGTLLGAIIFMGAVLVLLGCYGLYCLARRQRQIKHKDKFLKRIGGQLLERHMTSGRTRLFTAKELEVATDCFNAGRVLGRGSQGTVYKGMLADGRVVAVKKSSKVDESRLEQFVNEVVILSQINHRNVVKLLGCCLEMEVPLLIYEFIPNGALYQHIHSPSGDFPITWKTRLRIAAESASAIAYLHSSSPMPIYHRDIKSSNILLDEQYRAKVSDFGISRIVTIDQTHLTTGVQGTFGYLDPEYFRSNRFTEKSDVYSFGVVLAELLTSMKPLPPPDESGNWRNLAMEFILHMENSTLFDIVDARFLEEAKEEELLAVANVAMRCLNSFGKQRPTMKEVASALEGIRSPKSPSTTEQNHPRGDDMVMEMESISDDHMSSRSFFCSEHSIGDSRSFEIQPLKHHTV